MLRVHTSHSALVLNCSGGEQAMSARLINRIDTRPLVHGLALADSMSVPYLTLYPITIQISDCMSCTTDLSTLKWVCVSVMLV